MTRVGDSTFLGRLNSLVVNKLLKKAEELWPALLKYFLTNAPNPEHFSVSSVSEPVNSETLSMQKASIEIKGNELVGLLKTFLTNILADEKGMKELIGQLYDVLVPVIKEQMKAFPTKGGSSSELPDLMMAYLDNKTLAVEFVYTTIHQFLRKALDDWDTNMKKTLSSVSDSQAKALLSDKTLDSAPILKNGATFVPLRFIAEQLGCKVGFDTKTGSVTITRE